MFQKRIFASGKRVGLREKLIRGALGVGGLKIVSIVLGMAGSILFARGLGPDGYGQYVFVMAVITLLSLPVGSGYEQLVTREVARFHLEQRWGLFRGFFRRAMQWVGLSSVLIALVIGVVAGRQVTWAVNDRWTLLLIASLMLPLLGVSALQSSVLRGLSCVFHALIPEFLVRPSLHLLIASGILMIGFLSPLSVLIGQICATVGAILLGAWLVRKNRPVGLISSSPEYVDREWGKALLPFMLLASVNAFNSQFGILAVGFLSNDAAVGLLRVAQSGATLVALSLAIVNLVIGPYIARAHRSGDLTQLAALSRQSAFAATAVALPVALPLIFLGGPIIHLVYGEAYSDGAVWPLAILATAQLISVAFGPLALFLVMSGYERDILIGHGIALATNTVVAILLVPEMGAVGAALAIAFGTVIWNAVLAYKFAKRLHFKPSFFGGRPTIVQHLKDYLVRDRQ